MQTIYAVFGNKRALLGQLLDVAIAGDDERVAVNDRDWMEPVFTAPTSTERLHAYASVVRRINGRAGDLFGVLESAASIDSELVDLARMTEDRRRSGAKSVIDAVRSIGRLREGLDVEHAVDVLWLLNGSAVFRHLVRNAGWSLDEYEQWLAAAMVEQLLGSATST